MQIPIITLRDYIYIYNNNININVFIVRVNNFCTLLRFGSIVINFICLNSLSKRLCFVVNFVLGILKMILWLHKLTIHVALCQTVKILRSASLIFGHYSLFSRLRLLTARRLRYFLLYMLTKINNWLFWYRFFFSSIVLNENTCFISEVRA